MVYTTSLENQVFSLGQRINRLRAAQKVLTLENQFMIKTWAKTYLPTVIERDLPTPHPLVQHLANNDYSPPANVLTAIAWSQYPNESFYRFHQTIHELDQMLAEAIYNVDRGCPQSQRSGLGRDSEAIEWLNAANIAN